VEPPVPRQIEWGDASFGYCGRGATAQAARRMKA
jgi:hypothetical protein